MSLHFFSFLSTRIIYFVTCKNNHTTGLEEHIASPLQNEAQLNVPNMNKTNSKVLDESPGFSNQNDVGESGIVVSLLILAYLYATISLVVGRHMILFTYL
jgi:hypothetical protein